jgi:hypothetical protein
MPEAIDQHSRPSLHLLLEAAFSASGTLHPIARLSVIRHIAATDTVHAVAHAGLPCPYLDHLSLPLSHLPGLDFGTAGGRVRVIHDFGLLGRPSARHGQALLAAGLRSSLTIPIPGAHDVEGGSCSSIPSTPAPSTRPRWPH